MKTEEYAKSMWLETNQMLRNNIKEYSNTDRYKLQKELIDIMEA